MNNLLSVKQVAFILKVHPLTIRRYIKDKKLKAVKVGGNVRIQENDLQELNKEVEPTPSPSQSEVFLRLKKMRAKEFLDDDPFLRMKGRAASLYEK